MMESIINQTKEIESMSVWLCDILAVWILSAALKWCYKTYKVLM
jgi:hypothetical protein